MTFAFLVAGVAEAFLFGGSDGRAFSGRGLKGTLKGLIVGPAMTLCSACIVPDIERLSQRRRQCGGHYLHRSGIGDHEPTRPDNGCTSFRSHALRVPCCVECSRRVGDRPFGGYGCGPSATRYTAGRIAGRRSSRGLLARRDTRRLPSVDQGPALDI